jgi:hypothetical protein
MELNAMTKDPAFHFPPDVLEAVVLRITGNSPDSITETPHP